MPKITPHSVVSAPSLPSPKSQTHNEILLSSNGFDLPDLAKLQFVKNLPGADGGVDVFIDPDTGKKYCIKSWVDKNHAINEIIAGELLRELGLRTPKCFVIDDQLPGHLISEMRKNHVLFRLSEFIEGKEPTLKQVQEGLKPHYTKLAFLSMWDTRLNNVLITRQGDFYYMDTGSALLFLALGGQRQENRTNSPWSAQQVTELASFETHGSTVEHFQEVTEVTKHVLRPDSATFDESIDQILAQKHHILALADNLCHKLHYAERAKLMGMLTARFQHYELLQQIKQGKLSHYAERFALAGAFDAGGVMTWTMHEGQAKVLMGKRATTTGTGTWVILGGGSDQGETLSQMSAREVLEESNDHIKLRPVDLEQAPTHDVLALKKDGDFQRFRTYLAQVDYVDPTTLTNPEYSQYAWVSAEELLGESQGKKGSFELFEPFRLCLEQPVMQDWLLKLSQGKSQQIKKEATQGIAQFPKMATDRFMDRVELTYAKERRITEVMAKGVVHKQAFKKELAQRVSNVEAAAKPAPERNQALSASHQMLNRLYPGLPLDQQIRNAIIDAKNSATEADVALVHQIIEVEAQHPQAYFAYHALKSEIWLTYRVLSYIRHYLEGTQLQTDVLRSMQSFFEKLPDAKALRDYILGGGNEEGKDYHGISCNPTLFSNITKFIYGAGESTLEFFLKGDSIAPPEDIWFICGALFKELGLPEKELLDHLRNIYRTEFKQKGIKGALLQFMFEDRDLLDQATYVSSDFGFVLEDTGSRAAPNSSLVLDQLKNGQELNLKKPAMETRSTNSLGRSHEIQLRLHADLATVQAHAPEGSQIVVRDYFRGDVQIGTVDQQIEDMMQPYMPEILHSLTRDNQVYVASPPTLQKAARVVLDVPEYEREDKRTKELTEYWMRGDLGKLLEIIISNPELLEVEIFDSRTMSKVLVKEISFIKIFLSTQENKMDFVKNATKEVKLGTNEDWIQRLVTVLIKLDDLDQATKISRRVSHMIEFREKIDALGENFNNRSLSPNDIDELFNLFQEPDDQKYLELVAIYYEVKLHDIPKNMDEFLAQNPDIKKVTVTCTFFSGDVHLLRLIRSLKGNTSILYLDLSQTRIESKELFEIAELLRINKTLKGLDLTRCPMNKDVLEDISASLKVNEKLEQLNLTNCSITYEEFEILARSLQHHRSLKDLNLSHNNQILINFSDEESDLVQSLTTNKSITHLNFCNTGIDLSEAKILSEILQNNNSLTHLDLGNNNLGKELYKGSGNGLQLIAKALEVNQSIVSINLSRNILRNLGCAEFLEMLKKNKHLTYIDLRDNYFSDDFKLALDEAQKLVPGRVILY